jgi:hypothetical protein
MKNSFNEQGGRINPASIEVVGLGGGDDLCPSDIVMPALDDKREVESPETLLRKTRVLSAESSSHS